YPLLSGGYIYDSDLMKDRVVLDYDLSWKLFGGTQLEGMTVKINGKPYYVAGVIQRETDKFTKKAFTGEPVIFMSYSAFSELNEEAEIGCYELSMPDPISEFSKITATEGFASSEPVVVENSKRFGFMNIYNIFKNFGSRSVADKGVIYPYWENAARVAEIYIARLYVIIALLAAFPFICLIILLVRLIKLLKAKLKLLGLKLWDAWDDRYARRAARQERRMMKRRFKNLPPSEEEQFDEHSDENEISVNEGKGKSLKPIKKIGDTFKKKFSGISSEDKKSRRTTKQQGAHKDAEEPEILSEKEIAMDIESIVREIMNESADSGFDSKS
ncbi:MAG: ABC transporter permease, partial [Clostridiales bacterium]|nr:ABC transporter permease [Clostridiales bacterium]